MNLEYVDIFYSHRPDPDTPLEETMGALAQAVHQGKALYAGISSYPAELTKQAAEILKEMGESEEVESVESEPVLSLGLLMNIQARRFMLFY